MGCFVAEVKETPEQLKTSSCSADAKAVSSMALFHPSKSDQARPDGNIDHDERTKMLSMKQ